MNFTNIRELILEILTRVEKHSAYLNILIKYYLNQYSIKSEDKALVQEITYGVTRFRKKLDWIIDQFLDSPSKKIPLVIHNILRMGVYQIVYLDKVPNYAIVNEAVDLAKKSKYPKYSKLVNAILRNIIRKLDDICWPDVKRNPIKYISVFYSFPEWLIKRWVRRFGQDLCVIICQSMNKKPNITLHLNSLKIDMPDLKKKLSESVILFKEGQYLPLESLILEEFVNIGNSAMFKNGLFSIQDESSSLASRLLDPLPGQIIIDMCSGPGGKTSHMAQLMKNQGEIIAFEKNQKRLEMVKSECRRLGINNVTDILSDVTNFDANYLEKADKILVDAPCSGTGVIRKKPDLKWKNINDRQLKNITKLQEKILNIASSYLKPGGELLYSTCSIEAEENDWIIKKFLKNNKNFIVQDTSSFVNEYSVIKYNTEIGHSIQILPGYSGKNVDGFYMVKMKKCKTG
ncbi:MAG: 16S rRNA (cytosine(967)-C(5))-methyltransferase RsmB [Atribacterota bacterium]